MKQPSNCMICGLTNRPYERLNDKNINLRKCREIKEIINTAIKDESNSKWSSTKAVDQFLDALKTKRRSNNDV
ncbi:hypothetical protein Patl1_29797 [Pistacia atlantica]|uniref:Uncharacterized protein n=1 Tax=Pistacia atlantica TaxID=434234 RepID=A0ACC1AGB3_9ROSI|nr:hypothetical protein Patl1_29797 [Pistacia atlantica]